MSPELTATRAVPAASSAAFEQRRARSQQLRERYAFAADMFAFYEGLLAAQAAAIEGLASDAAGRRLETLADIATAAAETVMPAIIDAAVEHGPEPLARAAGERWIKGNFVEVCARWLADDELSPIDRFMARAATQPVLELLAGAPDAWRGVPHSAHDHAMRCPVCRGLPQLAYFDISREALMTGPRRLLCSRCSNVWTVQRLTCAHCGEQASARLAIYGEKETLPHMRVDGCETCKRYLVTIDLHKDSSAVPVVDELAALPLDLYAQERGLTKIMPNLLGN